MISFGCFCLEEINRRILDEISTSDFLLFRCYSTFKNAFQSDENRDIFRS